MVALLLWDTLALIEVAPQNNQMAAYAQGRPQEAGWLDREVDNLVYNLYGLTEVEREIVDKETESGGS